VTANGDIDSASRTSAMMRMDPRTLNPTGWFSPTNAQELDDTDADIGTTGAILIPGTDYVLTSGKEGIVYSMNRNNMTNGQVGENGLAQALVASDAPIFNMAVLPRTNGGILYTHASNQSIRAWKFENGKFATKAIAESTDSFAVPYQGMTITTNAAGTDGILWVLAPLAFRFPGAGRLVAYKADDLSLLWDSQMVAADAMGNFTKFANPTVAAGKVYVPTISNRLVVYGAKSAVKTTPAPVVTAVVNAASLQQTAVVPGSLVAILGQNLGSDDLTAKVQVTMNGIAATVTYASASAVTAVVPAALKGQNSASIVVTRDGVAGAPVSMDVAAAAPGIFSTDATGSGQAAAQNEDGTVNGPDAPAVGCTRRPQPSA